MVLCFGSSVFSISQQINHICADIDLSNSFISSFIFSYSQLRGTLYGCRCGWELNFRKYCRKFILTNLKLEELLTIFKTSYSRPIILGGSSMHNHASLKLKFRLAGGRKKCCARDKYCWRAQKYCCPQQ